MMGGMGLQMTAYRQNMECEREMDEITGLNNVIDLQPAMSPQQCQTQIMQQVATRVCGGTWIYGSHGECSCVRANMICDEDSRPGFSIYQLAGQQQYPHYPNTPQLPNNQYGGHGVMPGMQAGMYQGGMHTYQAGMQAGMYQGGMQYQAGMGYNQGMNYHGAGMGAYQAGYAPHHLSANAPCMTLDQGLCDSATHCKWTASGCEIYTEKTEGFDKLADTRWILLYVVVPTFITVAVGSLLFVICKSCTFGRKTNMNEPILMDRTLVV